MASVGNSVRKAIEDWSIGEAEFAVLHACNAIDGTASKLYPKQSSNARFTRLLRENYVILAPMAVPGVDILNTRWPVRVARPKAPGGLPDLADVIYGVHRCTHGHGSEMPAGFELIPDARGQSGITQMQVEKGKVRISDRIIFGLIGIAVFCPANVGQSVPDGYHLTFAGKHYLPINEWWGRAADFIALAATEPMPNTILDFTDWMEVAHETHRDT